MSAFAPKVDGALEVLHSLVGHHAFTKLALDHGDETGELLFGRFRPDPTNGARDPIADRGVMTKLLRLRGGYRCNCIDIRAGKHGLRPCDRDFFKPADVALPLRALEDRQVDRSVPFGHRRSVAQQAGRFRRCPFRVYGIFVGGTRNIEFASEQDGGLLQRFQLFQEIAGERIISLSDVVETIAGDIQRLQSLGLIVNQNHG